MEISYAYHIKVDDQIIFLGSELKVQVAGAKSIDKGTLEQIGPKGIYLRTPTCKNTKFINFNTINSIEVTK